MKAQNVFIATLIVTFASMAMASEASVNAMNMKSDELELEQEVESIEQFGEEAAKEETRKETNRLARETRQLENDIARLKRANERAQDKTKALAELYKKKATLAAAAQAEANRTEARKAKTDKEIERLNFRVKGKEDMAIRAVEKRKAADQRLAELKREETALKRRLIKAELTIKKNEILRKNVRKQTFRMAKQNAKLGKKVVKAERRAGRTSRAL